MILNLFKRLTTIVLLFLFVVEFIPICAVGDPYTIEDRRGRVLYRFNKDDGRVFGEKGDIFLFFEKHNGIISVREASQECVFDIICENEGGRRVSTRSSRYFVLKRTPSGFEVKDSNGYIFLRHDGSLLDWKVAVFVYDKMLREEQEQAAEAKAVKKEKQALGVYADELHEALADPHVSVGQIASMLREHPNWLREYDGNHFLPIHIAVVKSSPGILEILLNNGADINGLGPDRQTPLMMAIKCGNAGAVRLLLSKGVDVNIFEERNHMTPLMMAMQWKPKVPGPSMSKAELVSELILRGAKVDATNKLGRTVLMEAVLYGDKASVERVLNAGVDCQDRNAFGGDALYWAVRSVFYCDAKHESERLDITRLLISKGADVGSLRLDDAEHDMPSLLQLAEDYGRPNVRKFLLEHGVKGKSKKERFRGAIKELWTGVKNL